MGKTNGGERKQVLVRMSTALWEELAKWAKDDFRSINAQIEYLLTQCVRRRRRALNTRQKLSNDLSKKRDDEEPVS